MQLLEAVDSRAAASTGLISPHEENPPLEERAGNLSQCWLHPVLSSSWTPAAEQQGIQQNFK
jgi:hypothetical protein